MSTSFGELQAETGDRDGAASTQSGTYNRPCQSALAYRLGTHATFLRRLLARLHTQKASPDLPQEARPLAALTTRASDDPSIALLDSWAIVADVLSFYQERIANEGYLRTATERRSALELARAVGHELGPGVAASTFLAFTVEDAPGAPGVAAIPQGTRVQNVPAQGKLPQTFETVEEIEARAAWNALKPQLKVPQEITQGITRTYLKGIGTGLQPGDVILFVGDDRERWPGSERWDWRILQTVIPYPREDYTLVTWEEELGHERPTVEPSDNPRVFALRQRAALFGYNAPDWRAMPEQIKQAYDPDLKHEAQWPGFEVEATVKAQPIYLDTVYPRILEGSWVVLVKPGYSELYKVTKATAASRIDFTLTAKTTRLEFDAREHLSWFGLRDTVVLAESEQLDLAERPLTTPVCGNKIVLGQLAEGLKRGRTLIVSGKQVQDNEGAEQAPMDDEVVSEAAVIGGVLNDVGHTTLILRDSLRHTYDRATVVISANVARATHGETVREVLGSGDGARANQRFQLKKRPLTYVSAPTPSGVRSTLEVRVNGVLWQEAPSLYDVGADSRSYAVRIDDDGTAGLIFGDSTRGARLPTGQENVVATYRSGIGAEGEIEANSLTLLQTQPLGVRQVTNPLPATGAAAPEILAEARGNAPLAVRTLDRIVSLQDFGDFARAFAGIGKAQAAVLWNGETRLVHITVASASGASIASTSDLYRNLVNAIRTACGPAQTFQVDDYERLLFNLTAKVRVDPHYVATDVLAEVEMALHATFAFERRILGKAVTTAEVIREVHKVPGVVAVDLDQLYRTDDPAGPKQTMPAAILTATTARWQRETNEIRPAQLLLLNPAGVILKTME